MTYQNKTITQKALAELVGVDKGYINSILKGRKDAGDRLQDAISRALGFSHDNIRFFGRQLLAGHAPERVGVLARLFRENKVPSEMTPEELEVCEEFLGPPLAEAGAAWRAQMEARRNELARALSARPDALQYLRSLLYRGDAPAPLSNVEPVAMPDRSRRVPLVSMVRAGAWTEAEGVEPASAEEWVECSARLGPRAFALRVEGDSMEPEFWEGEYVVVDPDIAAASGDFVVAALGAGEATLKRYRREAGRDFLAPENARYPHMDMTDRDWRIIGRVMEKGKKY